MPYWRGWVLYIYLIGCRLPPLDGYVSVCLVLTTEHSPWGKYHCLAGLLFYKLGFTCFTTYKNNMFSSLVKSSLARLDIIHTVILPPKKRPRQWASHARWKVDAFWNTDFFLTYKTTYSYYLINMRIFLLPKKYENMLNLT